MTYIRNTVLANTLRFEDKLTFSTLDVSNNTYVLNDLYTNSHVTCSQDLILTSSILQLSSTVNFNSGLGILFTGTINTFVSGAKVGINTLTPTSNLHVAGTAILDGVDFFDSLGSSFAYSGYGDSGLIIGSIAASGYLSVSGSVLIDGGTFTYDNSTQKLCIGSSFANEPYLRVFSSTVEAVYEPDITLIASVGAPAGVAIWQQIGQYNPNAEALPNWDTYAQGLLITSANSTTNRHWFISPQFDGVGTLVGDPPVGTSFDNFLNFCYIDSSTTIPVQVMAGVTTYKKGYLIVPIANSGPAAGIIDFTGQHRSLPSVEQELNLEFHQGLIVSSDGTYCETLDPNDNETTISINEAIPKIKLSNKRNDKTVFGVLSDKEDESDKREFFHGNWVSVIDKKPADHRLIINSVGEGGIWICNINGNLENGDYITSCEIPGYGMKQDAQNIKNYTVAKITCDCDFDLNSTIYKCEEMQFSGSTYRRAFVGCTYHCG